MEAVPGIKVYMQNPPAIQMGGRSARSLHQYTIQGPDIPEMHHRAQVMDARMRELPGFQDVNTDLQISNPEVLVEIDRDKALSLGVTAEQIEKTLPIALGFGAGAEARRPLGLAVVGGLLLSQLLTLSVTPVVYVCKDSLQKTVAGLFRKPAVEPPVAGQVGAMESVEGN